MKKQDFDDIRSALDKQLSNPIILPTVEERKKTIAKEIEVIENLKRKYSPRISQLFKQFTI